MRIYDLHSHSTASDGLLSPTDLVARARTKGVESLALTDHDTVEGISEAQAAATTQGLELIPGVEISATWRERTLHIVGLGIDATHPVLLEGLASLQQKRAERAQRIAERLEKEGFTHVLAGAQRFGSGRNVTRTHFARYLVEQGVASQVSDVFKHYLRRGKPGYVNASWVPLAEAVAWINAASGKAVIAHPSRYDLTATKMRELLVDFTAAGGAGIEVIYCSGCNPIVQRTNAAFAKEFSLAASVGSDFHDPSVPWVELGRLGRLPPSVTPIWDTLTPRAPLSPPS